MYQTEFKFFWPLTEQPELDLDYSECEKPNLYTTINAIGSGTGGTYFLASNGVTPSWVTVSGTSLKIDTDTTVFYTKEEPPFYRKWLLKLLGIKCEVKA
jgi:hypothetical protein